MKEREIFCLKDCCPVHISSMESPKNAFFANIPIFSFLFHDIIDWSLCECHTQIQCTLCAGSCLLVSIFTICIVERSVISIIFLSLSLKLENKTAEKIQIEKSLWNSIWIIFLTTSHKIVWIFTITLQMTYVSYFILFYNQYEQLSSWF